MFVETLQRKLSLVLKKDYIQPPKMKLFDLHCYLPVIYLLINEEPSYLFEKFIWKFIINFCEMATKSICKFSRLVKHQTLQKIKKFVTFIFKKFLPKCKEEWCLFCTGRVGKQKGIIKTASLAKKCYKLSN